MKKISSVKRNHAKSDNPISKNWIITFGMVLFSDDVFFIWTGNEDLLNHFISFTQNYNKSKNIKPKIKFEFHLSANNVHFLDVTVYLKHGKLRVH